MNARAAEALYEAERKGVRQAFGDYRDGESLCAVGVLACAAGKIDARGYLLAGEYQWGPEVYGLNEDAATHCPLCGEKKEAESAVIIHLNDIHNLTFSEIARKLGPDSV